VRSFHSFCPLRCVNLFFLQGEEEEDQEQSRHGSATQTQHNKKQRLDTDREKEADLDESFRIVEDMVEDDGPDESGEEKEKEDESEGSQLVANDGKVRDFSHSFLFLALTGLLL
jgi:hypothetical protein